ncbi:hypothetical protein JTB14_029359 [Gonioctena quinquepunctata]|nr:hypothetical protein JTB14_029359 [Gonioctena quinquepunctata]
MFNKPVRGGEFLNYEIATACVGILAHFGNASEILADPVLVESLSDAGIILIADRTGNVLERNFLPGTQFKIFKGDFTRQGWNDLLERPEGLFVLAAVILLTMVKTVTPENFKGWTKNRIRTFSGTVGDLKWVKFFDKHPPEIKSLVTLQAFMSANFSLRRACFLILRSISSSGQSFVNNICREILNLMRGAEMHHLVLIDKYLFIQYRELLGIEQLAGLVRAHENMLAKLSTFPKEDMMYAKILYNKDDLAEMNRANFRTASIIATACARYENNTFDAYYSDRSEKAIEIANLVTEYLELRKNLVPVGVGEIDSSYMGEEERRLFFIKALHIFDRLRNGGAEEEINNPNVLGNIPRLQF